jgi:Ankyrin repeats (3 copies)/Ankyrin repeats (many copies)
LKNMFKAMEDVQIEEPARDALRRFFEESSAYLVNQQDAPSSSTAKEAIETPPKLIHQELAQRWDEQLTLDETVACVREGDADRAMALIESSLAQSCFNRDPAAFLRLLAVMAGSGHASTINYVRQKLVSDPELVRGRYGAGRTLLHDAAAAGNLAIVEMMLRAGADPNATDQYGHTPLYCVGNAYNIKGGENVVRVLVQRGANVHAHDGIKHCTALHMAARRGNVPVAAALLDCGADIEARDGLGDTALRRAVNCGKAEMAAFLLSRGADVHSIGSRGLTPQQVARGAAMKQLLSV